MKRILLAVALIAASQVASAGPIHDQLNACYRKFDVCYRQCLSRSETEGEKSLCQMNANADDDSCSAVADAQLKIDPYGW
jgi:hypothetical protein